MTTNYSVAEKPSSTFLQTARLLLQELRPKQWSKNVLVFAALIFSIDKIQYMQWELSIAAFILFCFVSGSVYILNDFKDREADRHHHEKRNRPIASGKLNPGTALLFGAVLLMGSFIAAYIIQPLFLLLLMLYVALNVMYSLNLKHIVILDVMTLSAGFVIRALAGGVVIGVGFTPWFLLCVFMLSLYLAISKRRHEYLLLQDGKGSHRKVLDSYSETLLDQLSMLVASTSIMSYSMFTFMSGHSVYLMWTIPLVVFGIFRYMYLVHICGKGGKPDAVLFEDKSLLICGLIFALSVVFILYYFG
jgi:4-hydroxybenzoate polyprenyltransferase